MTCTAGKSVFQAVDGGRNTAAQSDEIFGIAAGHGHDGGLAKQPAKRDLVADALAANPGLDAARAALRAARASRDAAAAQRYPSVSASGGVTRSAALGAERTLYDAGFDAGWELDVFGGLRRAVEAAAAERDAALADLRAARVSLVAEVALNYIDLRAFQTRLAIARANLDSQTETLQITRWRAEAGLASALDVEQARSNREATRAQIPTLDTGRAGAEHRLATLAGRAPGSLHAALAHIQQAGRNLSGPGGGPAQRRGADVWRSGCAGASRHDR